MAQANSELPKGGDFELPKDFDEMRPPTRLEHMGSDNVFEDDDLDGEYEEEDDMNDMHDAEVCFLLCDERLR